MKKTLSIDANTVSSKNQVKPSEQIRLYNENASGKRILIIGNSITKHAPAPQIGWHGNYGMAASCEENDYCHRIMSTVTETAPDTAFMILQEAAWERAFWGSPDEYDDAMKQVPVFDPDIVILRLGENISRESADAHNVAKGFETLCEYLSAGGKRKLLITETFWNSPWTFDALDSAARKYADTPIPLSDLGDDDGMKAIGLFEHSGVAAHPNDRGMAAIAERILERLLPLLR